MDIYHESYNTLFSNAKANDDGPWRGIVSHVQE